MQLIHASFANKPAKIKRCSDQQGPSEGISSHRSMVGGKVCSHDFKTKSLPTELLLRNYPGFPRYSQFLKATVLVRGMPSRCISKAIDSKARTSRVLEPSFELPLV